MLGPIFDRFVKKSPISVMARGMMERAINPEQINRWYDQTVDQQYTKTLLFSSVFEIMSLVVTTTYPSVNAAYQQSAKDIGVSIVSLYNKLNGIEPNTSAELVRYCSSQVAPIIEKIGGAKDSSIPGFRLKMLDGNCIEKSEHRIKELRGIKSGPLPGKSLVVYDPALRLPIDIFPCEDGHAQERSLLKQVLSTIKKNDIWIADRNFCTVDFTCGIHSRSAFFIIREHGNYPCKSEDKERFAGYVNTGKVYEQPVLVIDSAGEEHIFRRIRISLKQETRDGDKNIYIVTDLPPEVASARRIAELYRDRWTIETAFQKLEKYLNSEINTLGYPRAALFAFCVALVSYMIFSVIEAALASVHGSEMIEKNVSGYYIADEISGTYRGMMIAIGEEEWRVFRIMELSAFLQLLKQLAGNVRLSAYKKHPRSPKKPQNKRESCKGRPHVATSRLIANRKKW